MTILGLASIEVWWIVDGASTPSDTCCGQMGGLVAAWHPPRKSWKLEGFHDSRALKSVKCWE